jgi:hypothetical protein
MAVVVPNKSEICERSGVVNGVYQIEVVVVF